MHKIDLDCIPKELLGELYISEKLWAEAGLDPNQYTVLTKEDKVFERFEGNWHFMLLSEYESHCQHDSDYHNADMENHWINNGIMNKETFERIPHSQRTRKAA